MSESNKHVMECVEMDDGGSRVCLGCRQWVYGSVTEIPPGECPTPYKSPKTLLDEALAREASLREELAGLREELSEEFAGEERTPETLQEAIAWLKKARDDNKSRWLSATESLKLQGITIRVGADREAALREQLNDATTSLETISKLAGRDEFMMDTDDVRGYANSRAMAARSFLDRTAEPDGLAAKHRGEPVGFLHKNFRETQHRQEGVIFWTEESLFSIPVYLGAPVPAVWPEIEREQGIPGTSFQRLNQLANEGE